MSSKARRTPASWSTPCTRPPEVSVSAHGSTRHISCVFILARFRSCFRKASSEPAAASQATGLPSACPPGQSSTRRCGGSPAPAVAAPVETQSTW